MANTGKAWLANNKGSKKLCKGRNEHMPSAILMPNTRLNDKPKKISSNVGKACNRINDPWLIRLCSTSMGVGNI